MPGSKEAATANLFEISSNSGGSSFDVRTGAPRIEYRESMIDDTIRIGVAIVDAAGSGLSAAEALKLQGGEKVSFKYTDGAGNILDFSDENSLRLSHKSLEVKSFKSSSFIAPVATPAWFEMIIKLNPFSPRVLNASRLDSIQLNSSIELTYSPR